MPEAAKAALHQDHDHEDRQRQREAQRRHAPERDRTEREPPENRSARPQGGRAEGEQTDLEASVLQRGDGRERIAREQHHVDGDDRYRGRGPKPRAPSLAEHDPRQHDRDQGLCLLQDECLRVKLVLRGDRERRREKDCRESLRPGRDDRHRPPAACAQRPKLVAAADEHRHQEQRDESVLRNHDLRGAEVLDQLVAEVGVRRP